MGKKKGDTQQAYQNMMNNQVLSSMKAQLKPFVVDMVNEAATTVQQNLAKQQLSYVADANTRLFLLEGIVCEKLGYTREQLSEMILDNEDKALEIIQVNRAAQKGDHLRVGVSTKVLNADAGQVPAAFSDENRFNVKNLLEDDSASIFNLPVLSEALLGMSKDETKEVTLEEHNAVVKLRVHRICEKVTEEGAKQ